jgi:hypothetical protein
MRPTEGGWVADVSARHMLLTYVATVILMAVSHSIIAVLLAARRPAGAFKDERDAAIEARADRIEGYVLAVVINVLVVHALADAAFAGHIVKQTAIIWQYRA